MRSQCEQTGARDFSEGGGATSRATRHDSPRGRQFRNGRGRRARGWIPGAANRAERQTASRRANRIVAGLAASGLSSLALDKPYPCERRSAELRFGALDAGFETVKASPASPYSAIPSCNHEIRFAPNRSSALLLHG